MNRLDTLKDTLETLSEIIERLAEPAPAPCREMEFSRENALTRLIEARHWLDVLRFHTHVNERENKNGTT